MNDLQDRILDAARDLVAEAGAARVSMREVARRAGVSHQAPYHHFGDKGAILAAVAERGFAGLRGALADATAGVADPVPRLHRLGAAYVRFARANPGWYAVMFRPDVADPAAHPRLAAAADGAWADLVDAVQGLVDAGLVPAEERDLTVVLAWSTVHGLATLVLEGPLNAAQDLDALTDAVPRRLATLIGAAR